MTSLEGSRSAFQMRLEPEVARGDAHRRQSPFPRESMQLFRPQNHVGVELMYIRHSFRYWTVAHTSYDICGAFGSDHPIGWRYRGTDLSLERGTIGLLSPGEIHQALEIKEPVDYIVLFIEPVTLQAILRSRGLDPPEACWGDGRVVGSSVHDALWQLWRASQISDGGLAFDELFEALVDRVLERGGTGPKASVLSLSRRTLELVREYLHDHSYSRICLGDCARLVDLSTSHLCHAFKAEFGMSMREYHRALRISQARDLLRHQVRPVDVATRLGFSDQPHFGRTFFRELGLTPSQYRRT